MSNDQKIPFLDLASLHQALERRDHARSAEGASDCWIHRRPDARRFRAEISDVFAMSRIASGFRAARMRSVSLSMAGGVEPGDVVVTVPHTFIATTEAISQAGARPDFVDIDEHDYCMDPVKLKQYLEQDCYSDAKTGKLFSKTVEGPCHRRRPGAYLRANCGYGSDSRVGEALQTFSR